MSFAASIKRSRKTPRSESSVVGVALKLTEDHLEKAFPEF